MTIDPKQAEKYKLYNHAMSLVACAEIYGAEDVTAVIEALRRTEATGNTRTALDLIALALQTASSET